MTRSISLDGAWQLRGFVGVDAAHAAARRVVDSAASGSGWIDAAVPGSVVDDLRRAGEIPDPYFERNSLLIEWTSQRAWLYRRPLPDVALDETEHAWLAFDGVDEVVAHLQRIARRVEEAGVLTQPRQIG